MIGGGVRADWVMQPATALLRSGFRTWSPAAPGAIKELVARMGEGLSPELGQLGRSRARVRMAREAAAKRHGSSRMRDLVELALRRPVLTSAAIVEDLGVTRRTALTLVSEAEAAGHPRADRGAPRRAGQGDAGDGGTLRASPAQRDLDTMTSRASQK